MFHLQQENISITAPIIVFHRRTVVTDSYFVRLPIKISGTLSPSRLFLNHHRILAELFIAPIISHPNPIHLRTNSRVPMVTSQLPRQLHSSESLGTSTPSVEMQTYYDVVIQHHHSNMCNLLGCQFRIYNQATNNSSSSSEILPCRRYRHFILHKRAATSLLDGKSLMNVTHTGNQQQLALLLRRKRQNRRRHLHKRVWEVTCVDCYHLAR